MTPEEMTTEALLITALLITLQNLYSEMAEYYPSSVNNSPAMKATFEIIKEQYEHSDKKGTKS
jgi:hypothetical protein